MIDLSSIDQFRQLVAALPDGLVVIDEVNRVRLVNPVAESLLDRPGRDLVGRSPTFPIEEGLVRLTRASGDEIVLEVRVSAVAWDGAPCVVATLRDVTDSVGTDEQARTIERLRELDQARADFIGIVSHDLRSPMASIAGFAETLRANWNAFDEAQRIRMLDRISRSTAQLARLVENLLHVTQIESGNLSYNIKDIDVRDLIDRVVDDNAGEADRIEVQIADDLPRARADDLRQWQILTNLVTNALKFSQPDLAVQISAHLAGNHIEVSVADRGIGIKPEDAARLFEKFTRLEQPRDQQVKGSGLGLYICKAMVEGQGGSIWVESEPGRGSTFTYTIPAAIDV